jgi:membrane-associated protease RseP (regulator of RpoE activity)
MKPAKTWCVAIGLLAGACLLPAARAQNSQDQRNSARGSGSEKSDDQNQRGSSAQNSPSSKSEPEEQPNQSDQVRPSGRNARADQGPAQNQNRNPNGNGRRWNPQGMASELYQWNQQSPGWIVGVEGRGLFAGSGTPSDLNLAAADDSMREHLNLPKDQGVVVIGVNPHSSAAQADIQQNDILLMLGDHSLGKPQDLYDRLKEAGEKPVSLTLLRSGSRKLIQVQPKIRVTLNPVAVKAPPREYWIGISVTALEPALRAQLQLSHLRAVIVNQVFPDSPAAHAGIVLHDIVIALDGKPIVDPNDVAKTVQAKGGKPIALELIGKGGKPRTVSVTPGRKKVPETSQAQPESHRNVAAYDVVHPGALLENYYSELNSQPQQFHLWNQNQPYEPGVNATIPIQLGRSDDNATFAIQPYQPEANSRLQVGNSGAGQKSQTAGPDLTKRLDTLDSELKELRKLVEELQKTATRIIERQKTGSDATTKE